jgi:hypothetical protein
MPVVDSDSSVITTIEKNDSTCAFPRDNKVDEGGTLAYRYATLTSERLSPAQAAV